MAYATQADLVPLRITQKELIQLTDDTGSSQVNTAVVNAALEEASGWVDSYCRNRYVTPLQLSDMVKSLTLDRTVWLLFSRRRGIKIAETVDARHAEALAFLKDVSAGKAQLDQPVGDPPQGAMGGPVVGCGKAIPQDEDLRFRDHNLKGYV